ncbi:MAG: hypothetical protein ABIN58_08545, partial [candidate division WOR-3 bacterium]
METRLVMPRPEEVLPENRRILARAGCPPDSGEDFLEAAARAAKRLVELARPAAFSADLRVIAFSADRVELEDFVIFSSDMSDRLAGAERVSLFLATIGPGPEEACRALSEDKNLTEALFLDAAASEMVEILLRRAHREAAARMSGFAGTARYAPGYGDFSLIHQARIVELLGGTATGVRVMEDSFMLIPKKSTT